MEVSLIQVHRMSSPSHMTNIHHQFPYNYKPKCLNYLSQKFTRVSCCMKEYSEVHQERKKNYYEVLGVRIESSPQQIKEAYRKLQKIYHPDIAGQKGHDYTLVLNEAYKVLMREDLRREYDVTIGHIGIGYGKSSSVLGYSSWEGPSRPQALFVDENSCIGCRECVHHAKNTFVMDDALARARVKVQYGDDDTKIQVSLESCPVNCIHWVDTEDLRVLEHLMHPQPKDGHGIYGQGWEAPRNVFMAANSFHKQLKKQAEEHVKNAKSTEEETPAQGWEAPRNVFMAANSFHKQLKKQAEEHTKNAKSTEEETPAQAEARVSASMKLKMESFSRIWSWMKEVVGHE